MDRPHRLPRVRRVVVGTGKVIAWPFRTGYRGGRGIGRGAAAAGRWLSGLGPRGWDVVIAVITLILFVIAVSTVTLTHRVDGALHPVVAAVGVLPILLARRSAFVGWLAWVAGGILIGWLPRAPGFAFPWQITAFLALLVLLFAVGALAKWREVAIVVGGTAVLFVAFMPSGMSIGWAFGAAGFIGVGALVRWLVLSRRELAREKVETEAERARRAVVEEKARIARDLHDIVAHRMSLVVVQAQSAEYRLGELPEPVVAEFRQVADQAREALNEVRGMLGVLRSDGQLPEHVPQPGPEEIHTLLHQARAAGLDIAWQIDGDLHRCGSATAMIVYRVLQESLANASRHARGAQVRVMLGVTTEVTLLVSNGPGTSERPSAAATSGHGIPGMVVRAESVGGTLSAGPLAGGGFEVRATLPLGAAGAESDPHEPAV